MVSFLSSGILVHPAHFKSLCPAVSAHICSLGACPGMGSVQGLDTLVRDFKLFSAV
jgi:hypothetical protein